MAEEDDLSPFDPDEIKLEKYEILESLGTGNID